MPRHQLLVLLLAMVSVLGGEAVAAASISASEASGVLMPSTAPPAFQFYAYERLSPAERRVLDASRLTLGAEGSPLGGRALYEHLASAEPKAIANFLNQMAVLAATRFADGRTALDYVQAIEGLKISRVYARVDPALYQAVKGMAAAQTGPGVAFIGPEDSHLLHGRYNTSFRENRPYTSQQLSFSAEDGFSRVDIDLDEECPYAGSTVALAEHAVRVIKHSILRAWPGTQAGEYSEPDYFYRALTSPPQSPDGTVNPAGRGLTLNYQL